MSTFDPATFENAVIDQANEVEWRPTPAGEYECLVESVRVKGIKTKDRGEVPVLEVLYNVMEPSAQLRKDTGKTGNGDKVLIRHDIWLDIENGTLAFGLNQNVALGRLRAALGLNKPGKPFTFKAMEGQGPVRVFLDMEERNDKKYNKVLKVEALR